MKKRITTLVLGLLLAMELLAVTAWADEAPTLSRHDVRDLVGSVTLECEKHQTELTFVDIVRNSSFSLAWDSEKSTDSVYSGTLTVNAVPFVEYWDGQHSDDGNFHHRIIGSGSVTFSVTYTVGSKTWALLGADGTALTTPGVTFQVSCRKPALPTAEQLKALQPQACIHVSGTEKEKRYDLDETMYALSAVTSEDIRWGYRVDLSYTWMCGIPLDISKLVQRYNQEMGGNYIPLFGSDLWLYYDMENETWTFNGHTLIEVVAPPSPPSLDLLKELGITTVRVNCKSNSHTTRDFALTSMDQLSGEWVWNENARGGFGQSEYRLTLTDAAARDFAARYGTAVGKTHSAGSIGYVALVRDSDEVIVYSGPELDPPSEVDPEKWKLAEGSGDTIYLSAVCTDDTHDTVRRQPVTPAKGGTVTSAKTFDGGIALYAGLSLLSVTGSAALLRKKKDA